MTLYALVVQKSAPLTYTGRQYLCVSATCADPIMVYLSLCVYIRPINRRFPTKLSHLLVPRTLSRFLVALTQLKLYPRSWPAPPSLPLLRRREAAISAAASPQRERCTTAVYMGRVRSRPRNRTSSWSRPTSTATKPAQPENSEHHVERQLECRTGTFVCAFHMPLQSGVSPPPTDSVCFLAISWLTRQPEITGG